jgi:predicted RNA-binding protein with PUA-like domain
VEVSKEAHADVTCWDPDNAHYDPKSTEQTPRWFCVSVKFVRKLSRCITLDEIKAHRDLRDMQLVKRSRLSVVPVAAAEWDVIVAIADGC